ncbi:hypothetical protein HG536_0C01840 [Torulaspora globosa]|uniref:Anaphase-promoting complex subunit 4 n=1 Tax=Torulaspora globosa TaxID=48254 RepID=A0A7G3ZET0_9SACH|nr:uncharacterized protein HG536_0C01840 [Torulaspora globosa]QLL32016.1 hypothetical protein HG536_0C01840 [Torulaspora globosa]
MDIRDPMSGLDYRSYNPLYPLYAEKVNKGLSIVRIADDARIATVAVRDINLLISYEWDRITGRHLTVFFKDGTARIHDVFQGGKLISLLRISTKTVDGALWDRMEVQASEGDGMLKFERDVTKVMPKMIRFARDTRQIFILPYEPPNRAWRLATEERDGVKIEKPIIDVHAVHKDTNDLLLMFDGEYVLRLPSQGDRDPLSTSLEAMFAAQKGVYHLFFREGNVESLRLSPVIKNSPLVDLIKSFITMTQLSRYLQNHLELIRNDLIAPYNDFLERVCDRAFGYPELHEELETLLLTGCISQELGDWLCNTVNEKNSKKLRKLSLEMYQKSTQIFTLAFIPACERLILLSEGCRGLLSAIEAIETGSISSICHTEELTAAGQAILKLTLEAIQNVKSRELLFQTFWPWFDDRVHEALDEDYKPKLKLDGQSKTGYEIAAYLDSQFRDSQPSLHLDDLFKADSFKIALNKFSTKLSILRDQQMEPYLLQKCVKGHPKNVLQKDGPQAKMVGAAPLCERPLIVCFVTGSEGKSPWLSIRLLDRFSLDRAASDLPIQLPLGLEDRQIENVLILKVSSEPQDPVASRAKPNSGKTSICFEVAISCLQEDQSGPSSTPQLFYQCEITADLHIASLTMQETPS